jgi:hypothetical protein
MTMIPSEGPVVRVKPQSNIYTVLLAVGVIVLAVAIGIVVHDLMTTYGLSFGQLFQSQKIGT